MPPPEVVTPEEHPAAADSTVAAPEAEVDNKRKVEDVSADDVEVNGTGEDDAKRPRVDDGEPDAAKAVEQHKDDGSSVNMEEPGVAPTTDGAAAMDDDGDNGTPAPAPADSQAGSDDKKTLLQLEAAFDEAPQQEGDDAEAAAQDDDAIISRKIQVPTIMLPVLIGEGGETITSLKRRSGAEIKISMDSSDTDSNALTCSVQLVASSLTSVDKAELLVKRVIAEAEAWGRFRRSDEQLPLPAAGPEPEPFEMTIPANKVGLIIGKSGQTIRDLQLKSGAKIHVMSEGRIFITGNEKQTEAAKDLIKQALDQTFSNQLSGNGYGPQGYRRRQGHAAGSWWGPYYSNKFFKMHFQNHGAAAPAPDSASDDKPLLEAPQQEAGDAATDAQNISRIIQVPNSKVHVLIGKAGEILKNLQQSSGAKIQITRDNEVDPNAPTRPVELIGSLGSVDKAEQLIKTVIDEAEAEAEAKDSQWEDRRLPDGVEHFKMPVPNNKVGLIIGKGGETIKHMQNKSGARIQLVPLHLPEGVTTERTVHVTGTKKQVEVAKELIKQALNQTFSNQSDSELETARVRREAVLLESYTKLMTMDTTAMNDEMKDEHTKGLKMLREKIAGNTE